MLAAILICWVLFTHSGTRFAIQFAQSRYNALVPAQIDFESIEGTVSSGIRFKKIRVVDAQKRLIISVNYFLVAANITDLWNSNIHITQFDVDSADAFFYVENGTSSFGDLSLGKTDSPSVPSANILPVLPVGVIIDHCNIKDVSFHVGNNASKETLFSLNSLRAGGSLIDGTLNLFTHELRGVLPLLEQSIRIEQSQKNSVTVRNQGIEGVLLASSDVGSLKLRLKSKLTSSIPLSLTYELNVPSIKNLDAPFDGAVNGKGEIQFHLDTQGKPSVNGRFESTQLNIDPLGDMSVELATKLNTGKNDKTSLDMQLSLANNTLSATASYRGDLEGKGKAGFQIQGSISNTLTNFLSVSPIKGQIESAGSCVMTVDNTNCKTTLRGSDLQYNDIYMNTLDGSGEFVFSTKLETLTTNVSFKKLRAGSISLRSGTLEGELKDREGQLSLHVNGQKQNSADLEFTLEQAEQTKITVAALESSLRDLQLKSLTPFVVMISDNQIESVGPATVSIDSGTVKIKRFKKNDTHFELDVDVKKVDLASSKKITELPVLGIVSGTVTVDGPMNSPIMAMKGEIKHLKVQGEPVGSIELEAQYKNERLSFAAVSENFDNKKRADVPQQQIEGVLPVRIDLKQGTVGLLTNKKGFSSFEFRHLHSGILSKWMELPTGLQFDFDTKGAIAVNGHSYSLSGSLDGWCEHPRTQRLSIHTAFQVEPNKQTIDIQTIEKQGLPVALSFSSNFTTSQMKNGRFNNSQLEVNLSVAQSKIKLQGSMGPKLQFTGVLGVEEFALEHIAGYMDEPLPVGSVSGEVPFQFNFYSNSVALVDKSPWNVAWQLRDIAPTSISKWVSIPKQVNFKTEFSGKLSSDGSQYFSTGQINGWTSIKNSSHLPTKLAYELTPNQQNVAASMAYPGFARLNFNAQTQFDIPSVIQGDFKSPHLEAKITLGTVALTAVGEIVDRRNASLKLDLSNFEVALLQPFFKDLLLSANLNTNIALKMTNGVLSSTYKIDTDNINMNGWAADSLKVTGAYSQEKFSMNASISHKLGAPIVFDAQLPVHFGVEAPYAKWLPHENHTLKWTVPRTQLSPLVKLLGVNEDFEFVLGGNGIVFGNIDNLESKSSIAGEMKTRGGEQIPVKASFTTTPSDQNLHVVMQPQGKSKTVVSLHSRGTLGQLLSGEQKVTDIPIDGYLYTRGFNLSVLEMFHLPFFRKLRGEIYANLKFDGHLKEPNLQGYLKIRDGQFIVKGLANPIRRFNGHLVASARVLSIKKISFSSESGRAELFGHVSLQKDFTAHSWLKLHTRRFPITVAGFPKFHINTRSEHKLKFANNKLELNTKLRKTSFQKPVQRSQAAKIVATNDNVSIVESMAGADASKSNLEFHASISALSPIAVIGKELDTHWNANVEITNRESEIRVKGNISARKGTFNLFENIFTIDKGTVVLAEKGSNAAFVDLSSYAQISNYTVHLKVKGNLLRPKLKLSSSPVLSEEQILDLLITGDASSSTKGSAGTITTLLATQYPAFHNALYEKLGINQFRVNTTQSGSTSLKAGKKVTDRSTVFTVYNTNPAKNENEFEIQVETALTNRTSVGTAVGGKNSSLGVFRRFTIPNSPPQKKPPPPK